MNPRQNPEPDRKHLSGSDPSILTEQQIGELLSTLQSDSVAESPLEPPAVRPYDFSRPHVPTLDQLRMLNGIYDQFCKQAVQGLKDRWSCDPVISVSSVDRVPYEEFTASARSSNYFATVRLEPAEAVIVVEMDRPTSSLLTRVVWQGERTRRRAGRTPDHDPEALDTVVRELLPSLQRCWTAYQVDRAVLEASDSGASASTLGPPQMLCALVTLDVSIEGREGTMSICLPTATVDRLIPRSRRQLLLEPRRQNEKAGRARSTRHLRRVPLDVTVCYDAGRVSLSSIANLKVGEELGIADPDHVYLATGGVEFLCRISESESGVILTGANPVEPNGPRQYEE